MQGLKPCRYYKAGLHSTQSGLAQHFLMRSACADCSRYNRTSPRPGIHTGVGLIHAQMSNFRNDEGT